MGVRYMLRLFLFRDLLHSSLLVGNKYKAVSEKHLHCYKIVWILLLKKNWWGVRYMLPLYLSTRWPIIVLYFVICTPVCWWETSRKASGSLALRTCVTPPISIMFFSESIYWIPLWIIDKKSLYMVARCEVLFNLFGYQVWRTRHIG